jgi:hypothetical protein
MQRHLAANGAAAGSFMTVGATSSNSAAKPCDGRFLWPSGGMKSRSESSHSRVVYHRPALPKCVNSEAPSTR